jgi:hypothetical protein
MLRQRVQSDVGEAIQAEVVDGILRMTVRGPITPEVGDRILAEAAVMAEQSGVRRVLYDFRAATLIEGVLSLIRRVKQVQQSELLSGARTAMVCKARTNDYVFLETTCIQHGIDFRVFTDGAAAEEWIQEPPIHRA